MISSIEALIVWPELLPVSMKKSRLVDGKTPDEMTGCILDFGR